MSHMVIFRGAEGKAGYHQADDLEGAIRFVERVRNEDGVEQARIFRMEEVGFEFRPYYRVQVEGPGVEDGNVEEQAEPMPEPVPVNEDSNGRKGLFTR